MGVTFYLVDDEHRRAYVLGKGNWVRDPTAPSLGGAFVRGPLAVPEGEASIMAGAIAGMWDDPIYGGDVLGEIMIFLNESRWLARLVDDTSSELEREANYLVVGSRYRNDEDIGHRLREPLEAEPPVLH